MTNSADDARTLIAYRLPGPRMDLVPAASHREWMDATHQRFANRRLPLLLANQAGWFLLNSHTLHVVWTGGDEKGALRIANVSRTPECPAMSHFGHGILTFHIPYLIRTPPGYNLLVRGPANWSYDGAYALEGIVETDWSVATFTMNWRITAINRPVVFKAGDPICMMAPQRRGELEAFVPEVRDIRTVPEIARGYQRWAHGREQFNAELELPSSDAVKRGWQKDYFRGRDADGIITSHHQTKLALRAFVDLCGTAPTAGDVDDAPASIGHDADLPPRDGIEE